MNKIIISIIVSMLCICKSNGQVYVDTLGSTIVHIKTLLDSAYFINTADSSSFPGSWDLHWGPDNKLWFSNNNRIERYDPNTGLTKTLLKRKNSYVMGITTCNDFNANPYVYAVVDTQSYYLGTINHFNLYRYTYDFVGDSLKNETFILSWYHVSEHSGGRLMCGQDNKIYATTAEYFFEDDTLFYNSGKILRFNYDGTVPNDNPRADYTYSFGHRVPQGIVQVPNGNIISSEYGQLNDELNLIQKNKNYGWQIGWQNPQSNGLVQFDGYTCQLSSADSALWIPQVTFPMDVGINPPSGIDYYNHAAIPEFNGIIEAITGVGLQGIIACGLNSSMDSVTSKNRYLESKTNNLISAYERIRDVLSGPNGEVYFIGGDRSSNPSINVIYNPLFTTNVQEQYQYKEIVIFPNPTNSLFTIRKDSFEKLNYEVMDYLGKTILNGDFQNKETIIDLENYPNGLYLVRFNSKVIATYKVIKMGK
jgi:aldose sugar dehydrogenase